MSKLKSDKRDGGRVAGKPQFNHEIEMRKIHVKKKRLYHITAYNYFKSFTGTLKTVKGIYLDILSFTYLFVGLSSSVALDLNGYFRGFISRHIWLYSNE